MAKLILKLLILPVIGLIFLIAPTVMAMRALRTSDLVTMDVPGTKAFDVAEADEYTLWQRSVGVTEDSEFRVADRELPAGLSVYIRRASDGTTAALENHLGSSVQNGSNSKKSLARAYLVPGTYELVATTSSDPVTLVVSKDPFSIKGFFLGFACFSIGILLLIGGGIYAVFKVVQKLTARPQAPLPY